MTETHTPHDLPIAIDEPATETWYFTFCSNDPEGRANNYVAIRGDCGSAREEMFTRFGDQWAFQYSYDTFKHQPAQYGLTEIG